MNGVLCRNGRCFYVLSGRIHFVAVLFFLQFLRDGVIWVRRGFMPAVVGGRGWLDVY